MAHDAPSPRTAHASVVRALAAELGHELQGPLNLFRLMIDRLGRGEALDEEDVGLMREELERLTALSARLRSLARNPASISLRRSTCTPAELVELALLLSPATPSPSPQTLELDLPDDVTFSCDMPLMAAALAELIDNAWSAKTNRAGVRFMREKAAGFCVWDDGPGFSPPVEQSLAWGVTTKAEAAGLGLTLAMRVARAHGFRLELRRVGPLTEALLFVAVSDVEPALARVTA